MDKSNKNKKAPSRICYICGKEIEDEDPEYIRTRRRTDIYMHKRCVPGRRKIAWKMNS